MTNFNSYACLPEGNVMIQWMIVGLLGFAMGLLAFAMFWLRCTMAFTSWWLTHPSEKYDCQLG